MANRETKDQINSQYIANKVNPLLEKLVIDLLIHKPENSVYFYLFKNQYKLIKKTIAGIYDYLASR